MPTFKTYIYSNDGNTLYGMKTDHDIGSTANVVTENGITDTQPADWTAYNGATISEADNSFILPITIQGLTLTANSTNIDVAIGQSIITGKTYYCVEASTPQPTLTFKHFFDAGTIGSGTVKFRHYSQQEPTPSGYTDCITFTGETSDFTLAIGSGGAKEWDGTVQYSTDHNTWMVWDGTAVSSVNKKLYLRGSGNTKFWTNNGAQLSLSARAACSGNLNTLLEYSNPPTTLAAYCYRSLFSGCTSLTQAPTLPATTLADYCYSSMFYGCTSLTQAPALPATTLAAYCYRSLFSGCTNLAAAPELPATTLANGCYSQMFDGCSDLTAAPELPATTLAKECYFYMFYGCSNLTQAPALPATTLADYCYSNMFRNCTGLTAAPELPATILAKGCYTYMFSGCRSLKISSTKSTEYPTDWRIPSSGTISTTKQGWNAYMLQNTGGTFTGDPSINTTYYGAW